MMLYLALLFFDFVAAETLLGLSVNDVLAQDWIVFLEAEFIRVVHRIFLGVVSTIVRFLRH